MAIWGKDFSRIKKNEKIETGRNASNHAESIQIAPKDFQKLELMHFSKFFQFLTKLIKFDAD